MYKILAKNSIVAKRVVFMPSCHSTNDICAGLAEKEQDSTGLVVITDFQEKGRGQSGNLWYSKRGENIILSYYLNTSFLDVNEQYFLSMAVCLAVSDTVEKFLNTEVKIKWPNDIYVSKKISGILIQNSLKGTSMEYSIIGIGLNVNQVEFPIENATSLRAISGKWYLLNSVFEILSIKMEYYFKLLKKGNNQKLKNLYMNRLWWLDEDHEFESKGKKFRGSIKDVSPRGNLIIDTQDGIRKFTFKEVSFIN